MVTFKHWNEMLRRMPLLRALITYWLSAGRNFGIRFGISLLSEFKFFPHNFDSWSHGQYISYVIRCHGHVLVVGG